MIARLGFRASASAIAAAGLCSAAALAHAQDAATSGLGYGAATRDAQAVAPDLLTGRAQANVVAAG